MGLGNTVTTITLILARPGIGIPDAKNNVPKAADDTEYLTNKKGECGGVIGKARGGTLIICPMALLGQWKDELIAHSKAESISVSIYYGGERSNDPKVIAESDVVLTTYGVLTAAYKTVISTVGDLIGIKYFSAESKKPQLEEGRVKQEYMKGIHNFYIIFSSS